MTKLVVDSNIVFSAILNVNSRIGQMLLTSGNFYDFYSPQYQIIRKKIAKLNENDFFEVYELILKNITILDHSIPN